MGNVASNLVRNVFGLRKDISIGFYITDFIFRKLLRHNPGVKWAIHHTSTIRCPEQIKRGKGVYPGDSPGVYINGHNGVEIGDYTNIGPNVGIISANHDPVNNDIHVPARPVLIGSHCWLGMGTIVLPGVQLGDFTIAGAGAVITKSFPEGYCVLAGNPARVIKMLDQATCAAFADNKA